MLILVIFSLYRLHHPNISTGGSSNSSAIKSNNSTRSTVTYQADNRNCKRVLRSSSRRINFTNDEDVQNHLQRNPFVGISSGKICAKII